jgi:hypothetical protein
MSSLPSVEVIDDIELSKDKRKYKKADYFGLGRKIIFEQKSLETDQTEKVQSKIDSYQNEDFFPLYYCERDINKIIKHFPDEEKTNLEVLTLITKQIEGVLSKANSQISSTENMFNLHDSTGILILLNDTVKILSPNIIAKRIVDRIREKNKTDNYRFNRIQYVIFISETHTYKGIPILLRIEGPTAPENAVNINEYLDYFVFSWGQYNCGEVAHFNAEQFNNSEFVEKKEKVKTKPKTRSDVRIEWYKKVRYLKDLTDTQVLEHGNKIIDTISHYMLKGGPRLPIEQFGELALQFGDFIEESNIRGLDLKEM